MINVLANWRLVSSYTTWRSRAASVRWPAKSSVSVRWVFLDVRKRAAYSGGVERRDGLKAPVHRSGIEGKLALRGERSLTVAARIGLGAYRSRDRKGAFSATQTVKFLFRSKKQLLRPTHGRLQVENRDPAIQFRDLPAAFLRPHLRVRMHAVDVAVQCAPFGDPVGRDAGVLQQAVGHPLRGILMRIHLFADRLAG